MAGATRFRVAQGGQVPFVNRAGEFAWLREVRGNAKAGEPAVVLVEGESGAGKSRLVREFMAESDEAGWQTLWTRQTSEPRPAHSLIWPVVAAQAIRAGLIGDAEMQGEPGGGDMAALAARCARMVVELGDRRPLILGIDDLQAASSAGLAFFLDFVAGVGDMGRTGRTPVLVLVTHQPPLPGEPLQGALARLRREPVCTGFTLRGLDVPEVGELLQESLGGRCEPSLVGAVARTSDGNPFFVIELANHLERQGALRLRAGGLGLGNRGGAIHLPSSATASVLGRFGAFQPGTLELLRTASLLGEEFSIEELRGTLGASIPEEALDAAIASGALEERPGGLRFAHDILRRAIDESIGPATRRQIHLRIAESLRERVADGSAEPVSVALHLLAADGGNTDPVEYGRLIEAGADAAMDGLARETALQLYEAALGLKPYRESLDTGQLGWLECRVARVNVTNGNGARARELYGEAIAHLRGSDDFKAWGIAVIGWERTFTASGEPIPDDTIEREFAEAAGDTALDLRARLLTQRADALQLARHPDDQAVARAAVELAERSADPETRAGAFATLGLVQMRHLDIREALESFGRAGREAVSVENAIVRSWGPARAAWPLVVLGQTTEADTAAAESMRYARETHDWAHGALSAAFLHSIRVLAGDGTAARDARGDCIRLIDRSSYVQPSFILDSAVAWDRMLRAEFDEAQDAAAAWERRAGGLVAAPLHLLLASRAQGAEAAEAADAAARPWRLPARGTPDFISLGALCVSAELSGDLGAPEMAAEVLDVLEPAAARGLVFSLAPPLLIPRVLAIAATTAGRYEDAQRHIEAAEQWAERAGARTEIALTALAKAKLLHAMGGARPDELRGLVTRSMEIARECGLLWLSTSAREFAARTGLAPGGHIAGTVFADELSGAEREVLEAFARGSTIPQIAAALLLHDRTVEAHLERTRRRLGIETASQAREYLGGKPSVEPPAGRPTGRLAELTRRELEVLELVAQGRTNQQIADELVISPHTAIRHVANILEKTGSANRVEAARLAAEARK